MKTAQHATRLVCGLILLSPALVPSVQATTIASIDFGRSDTSAVQAGFEGAEGGLTTTPFSGNYASGDLTLMLEGNGFFDRVGNIAARDGGPPFTYPDLYRDFFYFNTTNPATITLSGPAILPNTQYDIRIWSYDTDFDTGVTHTVNFQGIDGTVGSSTLVSTFGATLTDNFDFSDLTTYTSNNLGVIMITAQDNNLLRLNGLTIANIPEPSSAILSMIGLTGLLIRRRR